MCVSNSQKHYLLTEVANISYALGMEDGIIPGSSLSASSRYDILHSTTRARLNLPRVAPYYGAWSAKFHDVNPWIQVEMSLNEKPALI